MEAEDVTLRDATPDDVPAVVELWKEFMDFHMARDPHFTRAADGAESWAKFLRANMADDASMVAVAEARGELVGYLLAKVAEMPPVFERKVCGQIFDLAVTKRFRRTEIGRRLFERAAEWFESRGIDRIELTVAVSNPVSTAFWRRLGFKRYTERLYLEI